MLAFYIVFVLVVSIIVIFAFPRFSPIPYFPSNTRDKKQIMQALDLKNGQTVIDLGAGDGWVVFEASKQAKKQSLNTYFIALELNPILICVMWIKWLFHENRNNVRIVHGDMFTIDYGSLITRDKNSVTLYLYISPWLIEKALFHALAQIPKARFVSYYYPILFLKKREKTVRGVHPTFIYGY